MDFGAGVLPLRYFQCYKKLVCLLLTSFYLWIKNHFLVLSHKLLMAYGLLLIVRLKAFQVSITLSSQGFSSIEKTLHSNSKFEIGINVFVWIHERIILHVKPPFPSFSVAVKPIKAVRFNFRSSF